MTRTITMTAALAATLALSGCMGSRYDAASYDGQRAGTSLPAITGSTGDTWYDLSETGAEMRQRLDYNAIYAATYDGDEYIPAVNWRRLGERNLRQRVAFEGGHAPGTIVIDVAGRHLYLVESGGTAMRYGIAVGKDGFGWAGTTKVGRRARWPDWHPPASMIERKPELEEYRDGMAGGIENPLGARALYLFRGGNDTLYRIHGTNQPYSVGSAASSGCFRMVNQDVIDLYGRVGNGARVVVLSEGERIAAL